MLEIITGLTVPGILGMVGWVHNLQGRVSTLQTEVAVQKASNEGLVYLINTRFDAVEDRLDRIEDHLDA